MPSLEIREAIHRFLAVAREPVVLEPGEDPIPLSADNFAISGNSRPTLECWSAGHNLVRRLTAVRAERRGKLELETERFGGRKGLLSLIDLANPAHAGATRRGGRLKYREQFRLALKRQYPDWRIVELSTEQDLEHSLSPAYPRALLRKGTAAMAAIGAARDSLDPDGALTFGLIWLDYLRRRESRLTVGGLLVFLPIGAETNTCHRVRFLDPRAAQVLVFVHSDGGVEESVNPQDYTNFSTRLEPFRAQQPNPAIARLTALDGVQMVPKSGGAVSLAVRGVEFARTTTGADLIPSLPEAEATAIHLARMRHPDGVRQSPLYSRNPEAWLESQIRAQLSVIDPTLREAPLYGQAPQISSGDRGILDILAVDRHGRLAVIEVKAAEDIHLPLQALDYWMRVRWHLDRGDFARAGYFAGVPLRNEPPRLLLVAPALDFHPSNETILRFFSSDVCVERIGVGLEWRRRLRIALRETYGPCR